MRSEERLALLEAATAIAASIHGVGDPRREVAAAVVLHLGLDWDLLQCERHGWRWRQHTSPHDAQTAVLWSCELSPVLRYTVTECHGGAGPMFCAYVHRNGASVRLVETRHSVDARAICYAHFDAVIAQG